jgi:hypothetical protein
MPVFTTRVAHTISKFMSIMCDKQFPARFSCVSSHANSSAVGLELLLQRTDNYWFYHTRRLIELQLNHRVNVAAITWRHG